jgi:ATP-dependent protease ClpP protease subunit
MKYLIMFMLGLFAVTTTAQAQVLNPDRTMYISGVITEQTLTPLYTKMQALLKDTDSSPVSIIISSPGGEVLSGVVFINGMLALKARGISVDCYVTNMAASMAFQIYTQCSRRFALSTSFLLWHGVRTSYMGTVTSAIASSMHSVLARIDQMIFSQLTNSLSLPGDEIQEHFDEETLWSGEQLAADTVGFLRVQSAYPEVVEVLNTGKVVTSAPYTKFLDQGAFFSIWKPYEYLLLGEVK